MAAIVWNLFSSETAQCGQVLAMGASNVDERNLLDRTVSQIRKYFCWSKMRKFTHKQSQWLGQQRFQILGLAKIGAMADTNALMLEQKATRRKIRSILFAELCSCSIQ